MTQPQNLGQAFDSKTSETFVLDPAPAFPVAGHGARGAYHAPESMRTPQETQQRRGQPAQEYEGYSMPSRLQGVAIGSAPGRFAPAPAAEDGVEAAVNAKIKARELQFQLKLEMKHLEREARKLATEEGKLQRKMRAEAERGNSHEAQSLARSAVQTRKAIARLEQLKASMHGVVLQLTESIAAMGMRNCLKMSSDVMRHMSEFTRIPELEAAVQQLRREAAAYGHTAGCVDEALRDRGADEASAREVQRMLEEVALDRHLEFLAGGGSVPQSATTVPQTVPQTVPATRLPSMASTVLPPGWQPDSFVS